MIEYLTVWLNELSASPAPPAIPRDSTAIGAAETPYRMRVGSHGVVNDAAGIVRPPTPVPDRAQLGADRDGGRPGRSCAFRGDHRCPSWRGPAGGTRPGATRRHDPTCRRRDVHGLVHAAGEDGSRGHPDSHARRGLGAPSGGDPAPPAILPFSRADQP